MLRQKRLYNRMLLCLKMISEMPSIETIKTATKNDTKRYHELMLAHFKDVNSMLINTFAQVSERLFYVNDEDGHDMVIIKCENQKLLYSIKIINMIFVEISINHDFDMLNIDDLEKSSKTTQDLAKFASDGKNFIKENNEKGSVE